MKKSKLVILASLITLAILAGTAMAKYVASKEKETLYVAESFYFESDLLTSDSNTKTYTYQKGKNNIQITLKNNIDDLRYSDVDIEYIVRITDLSGTEVKNSVTGTLNKGSINTQIVNFDNLSTGSYTVTATATAPYEKTIKANFVIEESNAQVSYNVTDVENSAVAQLTITTNDYSGDITISWPTGVAPDSTNQMFSDINSGYNSSSKTITVNAKSQTIIQFFKEDITKKYTTESFSVN